MRRSGRVLCPLLAVLALSPALCGQIITTAAGNGVAAFSGDNGQATAASLSFPRGVAVDGAGNVFIADSDNSRIRRVNAATGVITTVAGNGTASFSGDNGQATAASLAFPEGVAVDGAGNLFIADTDNNRIRRVDASTGVITTMAGNGTAAFGGDGGPATAASLNSPSGLAFDSAGNLLIADASNNRVRRVDAHSGVITTVAGNGVGTFGGDGGQATAASLDSPESLAIDGAGNVFIADRANNRIRRVNGSTGIITTAAGNGTFGFSGDGGSATAASLNFPRGIAVDGTGNLFLSDTLNNRIRRVDASTGIITTVAGTGTAAFGGDGGSATAASLNGPERIAFDSAGNLFVADSGNNRLRRVASVGQPSVPIITTFAGNGTAAFSGDGGQAIAASLSSPSGVTVDSLGNLLIADSVNQRIRRVNAATGIITTVAGNGSFGFSGDGGPATAASLANPWRVALDGSGNLFIADITNNRVRRVTNGTITTLAGNASAGFSGDGGPATAASLAGPNGLAIDGTGNLYISDLNNNRIRMVHLSTGIISTVAGNGTQGFSGDGGPATAASLNQPTGVAVDDSGDLFIVDGSNQRIRRVRNGIITTVAGNGNAVFSGDGGPATAAGLNFPWGLAVDGSGNLFIADRFNGRVRRVDASNGVITTVAGTGHTGFGGDGGPATSANIEPIDVALDSAGNIFIADFGNSRIRRVGSIGQASNTNPIPTMTGIFPTCLDASAAGVNVRITGSGFVPGSVVRWNGTARTTQFVSNTALEAAFTSADLGAIGAALVTVFNPAPGGGASSPFSVTVPQSCTNTPAGAPPVIQTPASLSVSSAGSPASTVAPPCGNQSPANGVWLSYTAADDGTLNADTVGSTYQTIFAAYTGTPTNLTNVACNAAPPGSMVRGDTILPLAAALALPVSKGTTYLFLVTAANSDGGKLQFNLQFTGSARLPGSTFVTMLPHLVNGAGYITKLTVVNMSGATNNVVLNFLGQDGSIQSSQTILMQAEQTVRIASPESARNVTPQTTQWVTVGGDGRVAANLFFEVEDGNGTVINCIGFNDASSSTAFTVAVEFEPKPANASIGRTVGLALANLSASSNTVTLTLVDQNGATLGTPLLVTLAAFGKTGIDLSSTTTGFGNVLPASNFIGTLTGTSAAPFSVIALGDDFGPFFATPSLTTATTQVVPHIVSGAGYVTKITLVNLSGSSNTVTVTYFNQAGVQQGSPHTFVIPAFGTARDTTGEANRFITPSTTQWAVVTSTAAAGVNLFFEFMDSPTARLVVNTVGFNAAPELSTFTVPVEWQPGVGNSIGRTMGFAVANRNASAASITVTLLNSQGAVVATHALTLGANSQTTFNIDTFTELAAALPASNFIGAVVVTSNLPVAAIALEDDLGPFSATPVISGRP